MFFRKEIKRRPVDFLILFAGLAIAAGVFFSFPYRRLIQKLVVIAAGLYYLLWGIFHHKRNGDLCLKIVLEYFLFGLLGTGIVLSVLLRS